MAILDSRSALSLWFLAMTVSDAARRGFLDRASTSQLMVIPPAEYEAGMTRIYGDSAGAMDAKVLCADLRIYATTGWVA